MRTICNHKRLIQMWPKKSEIEGRAEIYLRWKNLLIIIILIFAPLAIALLFDSIIIKIICWGFFLLIYMGFLPRQGPCITAIGVSVVPWYVFLEWAQSQEWLAIVAAIITLIEAIYIRHRMRFIKRMREKEKVFI